MAAGGESRVFGLDEFGTAFELSGLSCPIDRCQIMSQRLVDGQMVASEEASQDFVDFWKENVDSGYVSPYPSTNLRRRMEAFYFNTATSLYGRDHTQPAEWDKSFIAMYEKGETMHSWSVDDLLRSYQLSATTSRLQRLQATPGGSTPASAPAPSGPATQPSPGAGGGANFVERTIQCIEPGDGVSFEVNPVNFPVYIVESKYNTDPNYDYGAFSQLQTKLNSAKLQISTFPVTFSKEGVFTFGDHETPSAPQTLVYVTSDKAGKCQGRTQWPLTSENMQTLGITKKEVLLEEFDAWLTYIPHFFILVAFGCCGLEAFVEARIEARE